MREDAEKMDENKKKDTLKRMGEMADLNAIRQIKECLLKNEKGDIKGTVQNYMMIFRDDPLIKGCVKKKKKFRMICGMESNKEARTLH